MAQNTECGEGQATRFKGEYTLHEEEQLATFGESLHFFAAEGVDNVIVYTSARHDFPAPRRTLRTATYIATGSRAMIVNS